MRAFGLVTLAAAAVASAQTLQPGNYEIEIEMQLPGSPQPATASDTQCLTPDDVRDFRALLLDTMGSDEDCTHSNVVTEGNKWSWDSVCDDTTSHTELTHMSDSFTAVVTTRIEGETFVANMRARRIGATCTPDDED